ncbi:MAG: hypothetical protein KF787_12350 [Phycisphaeraceae bacterium]|nr:hypothetical protein [Phycisphaerae bacterium]MBX3393427.1 hypothetical protein [Phycisphaeraceae bacterium]
MNGALTGTIVILISQITAMASAGYPQATGDRQSRFRTWLEREWVDSQSIPDLRGYAIRYVHEIHSTLTPEEAAELRRRIANKPDHPDHHALRLYDQSVASGRPFTIERALFAGGDRRWRWSRFDNAGIDEVMSDQAAWMWFDGRLEISAPDDRGAAGRIAVTQVSTLLPEVARFFSGGMGVARTANLVIDQARLMAADRWTVTATLADKPNSEYVHVFEGTWSDDKGRGFVDHALVYHHGLQRPAVTTDLVDGWKYVPELDRWIAHKIETMNHQGRRERAYRVTAIEPSPAPLPELLKIPSPERPDPIRGELAITSLVDHRTGRVMNQDADGRVVEGRLIKDSPQGAPWRYIGWAALAAIAVGALIYVRRSKVS